MANNATLLRANYGVYLAYPEAFANPLAPTVAELNDIFNFTSNIDGMVFDISCAILDDSNNIAQTDSDTDGTMTICDAAEVATPTFWNYEVTFDTLRDKDVKAAGVYNLARELTLGADRPYYVVTRIGKPNNAPFVAGDNVSVFGVNTDYPVEISEDGGLLQHGARFKNTGKVVINHEVAA